MGLKRAARLAALASEIRRYATGLQLLSFLLHQVCKVCESVVGDPVVNGMPVAEVVAFSAIPLAHLKLVGCGAVDLVVLNPLVCGLLPQCRRRSVGRKGDAHIFKRIGAE